jgi:uncharacterized protein YqjF (DUF2071 family)
MSNAKTFTVVETGLIVVGMPYSETLRIFKRASAALAYVAKRRASHAPIRGTTCAEICNAYTLTVVES